MSEEQTTQQEEPAIVTVAVGEPAEQPETPEQGGGETTETGEQGNPFRVVNGKVYQTPEDYDRAFEEAQRLIGRQGDELGKYRQAAPGQPYQRPGNPALGQQQEPDPRQLADFLDRPPSSLLGDQSFINFAQGIGIQWKTDEEGYVDTSDPANIVNLQYAREQAGRYVQQVQQQEYVQRQQLQQVEQQVEQALTGINPLLLDAETQPLTAMVAQSLLADVQEGRRAWNGPESFARDVADSVTRAAAKIMGNRGGTAAAQARQAAPPPPPPMGGGITGRAAGGGGGRAGVSAFEDLTDWGR